MDFLQKIGGRKFWMALIAVGVATFVELRSANGVSPTFATFLGSIVAAFSMANYAVTREHMGTKGGNGGNVADKLESLTETVRQANDPEIVAKLSALLANINEGVEEVKSTSGQLGTAVVNIGKEVQSIKTVLTKNNLSR